jgi:catalase-peroxidase
VGDHTITSGIEGAWTPTPITWDMTFSTCCWTTTTSWSAARRAPNSGSRSAIREETLAPAAHTPGKRVPTMMTTADMAFKMDPAYRAIMERFRADPAYFGDAFARAWFKLCHRDMGPEGLATSARKCPPRT